MVHRAAGCDLYLGDGPVPRPLRAPIAKLSSHFLTSGAIYPGNANYSENTPWMYITIFAQDASCSKTYLRLNPGPPEAAPLNSEGVLAGLAGNCETGKPRRLVETNQVELTMLEQHNAGTL